ncbi:MAG: alpha/beta hydrolase [Bacilli bacterium]|nr:alpha/beta hydrolase [Bacilli bacterium]
MTNVKKIGKSHLVINVIDLNSDTICLVLPGGGYYLLSNRESGPVATKLNMMGYNTAVLYYCCEELVPYKDALESLKELSKSYKNIIVFGFSAGGHLAALLATTKENYNLKCAVLAYPVITFGKYTHEETAKNFLGSFDNEENRNKYSCEKRVDSDTVPCFIWTTKDDELVPYENTIMYKEALDKYNIKNKMILYPSGVHGLALADETAVVNGDNKTYNRPDIARWIIEADCFIKEILNK